MLDSKAEVDKAKTDGWTPLMWAAWNGHTDTAKLLLEAKADIHKKWNRKTPLQLAKKKGHASVAKAIRQWSKHGQFFQPATVSPAQGSGTKQTDKENKYNASNQK